MTYFKPLFTPLLFILLLHQKSFSWDIFITDVRSTYHFDKGWINHFNFYSDDQYLKFINCNNPNTFFKNHQYDETPSHIYFSAKYQYLTIEIPNAIKNRLLLSFRAGLMHLMISPKIPDCFKFAMYIKYGIRDYEVMTERYDRLYKQRLILPRHNRLITLPTFTHIVLVEKNTKDDVHHMLFLDKCICISKTGHGPVFFHTLQDALNCYGTQLEMYIVEDK